MSQFRTWVVASITVLSVCSCGSVQSKTAPTVKAASAIAFSDFVPSPDGKIIAFEYIDRSLGRNHLGLGLLEWQTGKLTRIPNPPDWQMSEASFSYDGKRLLVAESGAGGLNTIQIAVVDLATMDVTEIIPAGSGGKEYPVFQPGTDNILYVQYQDYLVHHLVLLNPVDHTEKVILEKNDGFVTQIMRPSFLKPDEIVFQGRGPENRELNRVVTRLVDVSVIAVAYHLKFGAQPEILGPGTGKEKYSADTFT